MRSRAQRGGGRCWESSTNPGWAGDAGRGLSGFPVLFPLKTHGFCTSLGRPQPRPQQHPRSHSHGWSILPGSPLRQNPRLRGRMRDARARREQMDAAPSRETQRLLAISKGWAIRGPPGKSRSRKIRELIPFNYWADKAAEASLALLIHRGKPQRVGLFHRNRPHVAAAAALVEGWAAPAAGRQSPAAGWVPCRRLYEPGTAWTHISCEIQPWHFSQPLHKG